MSELLYSWLNDEVQLSRRITNFEEDFHNGFLFGQLLSKYSQQLNFHQFVDKDDKASRIKNFTLLFDTLKTLRVSFDSNVAMSIIEKKTGIAKKVLYQLKMQLEKTTMNNLSKLTKTNKPLSPLKKIPLPKEKFDKVSKQHFNKQLNQIHQAQKNLNLNSHLEKFNEFHYKQIQKAQLEEKRDSQGRLLGQMKFRQKQLDNIKKSAQFRVDWEQSNLQKWANNMAVRKLQEQKDFLFKTKIQTTKVQNKTLSELSAIKSLDKDLKDFEKKKLKKKDYSSSSSSSQKEERKNQQQQPTLLKKSSTKLKGQMSSGTFFFQAKSKIQFEEEPRRKKNPQQVEQARHQRQKRRRKMIVEQSKKHLLIKIDRIEKYIVNTLEQTSKQQKQIEYEIWRAWQNKQVLIQNKHLYNEKLREKEQTRSINSKFKDDELLKTYRQEHQKDVKDALQRQNKLKVHNSVKQRKNVYEQCKSIIENFISMTEVVYEYGQQKNKQQVDDVFLTHLLDQFVESARTKKQVAQLELTNYIHGKGQWKVQIKRDTEDQPIDPTEDNSLPNSVINNYYLGNILKTIFTDLYKDEYQNAGNKQISYQNLVAIMGLQFAGKKIVSSVIQQRYGFNIIDIPTLVQQKLHEHQLMKERGLETSGETNQLVEHCFNGKDIPNNLILNLIQESIEKNPKSVIINYPTTYQECVQFTKKFGRAQPVDSQQKPRLKKKIQQFSRLVWPSETKIMARSLKPCGLDFALWIDISPKTSLDRFLGRRWTIFNQITHINQNISNPNILRIGQKASPVILKNDFKLKNKSKIQGWLNQFGMQVIENGNEYLERCWQVMSGQCPIQELVNNACQIFEKNLALKSRKQLQKRLGLEKEKEEKKKREQIQKFQEELKEKCAFSQTENIRSKFKKALDSVQMEKGFLENIENLWNNTQKVTINGFTNVFQTFRDQQESKNRYISNTKLNFIRMLTRQDERFYLAKKFQNQYNSFLDENGDMVVQQFTKQELHQRIQDLQLDLFTLIQEKKEDALAEKENIMKSGWLENQLDQIISCIHILLQIELNRSFTSQQIISDFYSKKFLVNTGEVQDPPSQLNLDSELEIIKENSYPRLEKLISQAIRLFNREEEVVQDKNKKGGKAPPAKKDDKKQAKKGGKDEVEEKGEPTHEQKEYKKAINTEKAIFRYRVKVISSFAAKKLKQFQVEGLQLYSDLDDLLKYTDKVQNRSVVDMTKIFKKAIENQKKIENQVMINYIDVIESEVIRNFKKPKPIILPATQRILQNRFTLSSIKQLIRLFKNQSEAGATIKNNRLLIMLDQLNTNQRYRAFLPQNWRTLTKENHEKFVANFDKRGKGQIQLWIICTVIALSNCLLPSEKDIKQYQLSITDHNPLTKQIDRVRFEKCAVWFDSQQPVQQNVRYFDRNRHLKNVLFDVFKKDDGSEKIGVESFLKRIAFAEDRKIEMQKTYFQYAFDISN